MREASYIDASSASVGDSRSIKLHGPEAFEGMRRAGRLAADILDRLVPYVVPGAQTDTLDALVVQMC
ncbi:hypothetical protein [Hyphomicrobium sp. DY-1]|uniref:hypothetical protein n=1 Tax=Hyphomicrobium sp. DY-1 TaxID=3075650 RepID=UPI0039C40710